MKKRRYRGETFEAYGRRCKAERDNRKKFKKDSEDGPDEVDGNEVESE